MLLRMSTLFLRTLREDPADAEVPSHRLLVRAGYIRRAAPGIYSWLPLGLRVLGKVEQVVREEMAADPFRARSMSPRQTRRPDQADLLGWDRPLPVRQAARGRRVPLAQGS